MRSIRQRGVSLVGTAHGSSLSSLINNSELRPLVGEISKVTIGDRNARDVFTGELRKTRVERSSKPAFDIVVEMQSRSHWVVYKDTAKAVDEYLAGFIPEAEIRYMENGQMFAYQMPKQKRGGRDEFEF